MTVYVVAPTQSKLQGGFETIQFHLAENIVDHRLKLPRSGIIFDISHM